jgi:hypothetical protein
LILGLSDKDRAEFRNAIINNKDQRPEESKALIRKAVNVIQPSDVKRAVNALCDPRPMSRSPGVPSSPDGYYFDVATSLDRIGSGWVHMGYRAREVPKDAAYRTCCGKKYLWVCAEDMGKLSDFLLVLQKIARADFGSVYYPKPQTRTIQKNFDFSLGVNNYHANATIYVDQNGFLTSGAGQPSVPRKVRTDNVGVNADLRSVINASAKSPSP